MFNEDFLALIPGTMGEVIYQKNIAKKVPDKIKENFMDKFVNAKLSAMISNASLNPDGVFDPSAEFMKAREMAREELDSKISVAPVSLYLQVDQKESYDKIISIENDPYFVSWNFPAFILEFKRSYLGTLKKNI